MEWFFDYVLPQYFFTVPRGDSFFFPGNVPMTPLDKLGDLRPARRAFSLAQEFRDFAFKGNVIDLAVGVIIGAAFAKLIESLVKSVLMPSIGLLLPGNQGYLGWTLHVGQKEVPYGQFLGELVNFLLVALALYLFAVKFLGWIMKARREAEAAPVPPSRQEVLLTEIRDLLKQAHAALPPAGT